MIQEMDENIARVIGGKHVLVIGKTGSGKSWYVANMIPFMENVIVINPQEEEVFDEVTQVVTDNVDEIMKHMENGYKKIQFLPSDVDSEAIEQLEKIRRQMFGLASMMKLKQGQFWLDFIVDEAQTYAWKGSRNDLDNLFRRGRRYGIRGWALTQRPQNLSATIINNVDTQVIFQTGAYESVYFHNYKIPIEDYQGWLEQEYHYILFDGVNVTECEPI